jgi:hypothetical protein
MVNYGLFELNKLEDAQNAWEIFFGRFYSAEIPKDANVEFDPEQREFIPRKDKKAKEKRFSDIDGRTYHSDDFDDFLNGYTVKIPDNIQLNKSDLNKVENAILTGNYEDSVLTNESHVFYALWLFKQNKISRQQISTLLAREQFSKNYPIVKTFHILDSQGEFTEDAKKMLIPILKKNTFTKFEDWHLQRFQLLIQTAPKSEQVFYIAECDPNSVSVEGPDQLGNALARVRCWERAKYEGRLYDIHLSFGAIEARQIALNGVHGAAANRAKIGIISPGSIREGVADNYRPTAISINKSGVSPTREGIHDFPLSIMPAVTKHDIYHAQLHNTIPSEFHMAFNHMKETIAAFTKVKSSSTQWILTDREFPSLREKNIKLDPKKGAKYFTKMLSQKSEPRNEPSILFNDYDFNLSDEGIAIIRDMVNESEKWKKLYKIDIYSLGYPYDKAIQQMRAFVKAVENEPYDAKLFSLKYRIFGDLPKKTYQKASELITSVGNTLTQDLKFEKGTYRELKDRTVLKFNEAVLINGNNALRAVLRSYLNSKFTIQEEQFHCEFIQLEAEFKSIHEGSQLTKDKIEDACKNLNSLADKLMLLELSYKKIIGTRYTRRYSLIDNYFDNHFSFMKNPLTMSQRKHIGLLRAKMDNLINEHLTQITDKQEKEQFKWVIENYFKLVHHKDWRVSFNSISDDQASSLNVPSTTFTRP